MMKSIAITCVAGLVASSAFAGQSVATGKDYKSPAPAPIPCFKEQELQLDLFASYTAFEDGQYDDGFGGGIALNYFFTRYFGIGVDGNVLDGGASGVWDSTGRLLARYPLELGSTCIAPYAFGGGGVQADGTTVGTVHAGGGLEWRATPSFGVFGEGRYTWGGGDSEAVQARLGFRFVF